MQEGKYPEAARALVRCLELDPGNGDCRLLYSNALVHLGQPERAEEQMRQFLHNPPTARPPDLPSKPLNRFERALSPPGYFASLAGGAFAGMKSALAC